MTPRTIWAVVNSLCFYTKKLSFYFSHTHIWIRNISHWFLLIDCSIERKFQPIKWPLKKASDLSKETAYLAVCSEPEHAGNVHSIDSKMSSVVDPLLSTVTLDLLRPKETLGNPEEHFRKVSLYGCS